MINFLLNKFVILACLVIAGLYFLFVHQPALPKPLSNVQCVSSGTSHALVAHGKAKVFHMCLEDGFFDKPKQEHCYMYSGKAVCANEAGAMTLTHTANGEVYVAMLFELDKNNLTQKVATTSDDTVSESELYVLFDDKPNLNGRPNNIDEKDVNEYQYLNSEVKAYLPAKFALINGAICAKYASGSKMVDDPADGACALDAKTKSLYWRIVLNVRKNEGAEISAAEYNKEFIFWQPYLDKILKE